MSFAAAVVQESQSRHQSVNQPLQSIQYDDISHKAAMTPQGDLHANDIPMRSITLMTSQPGHPRSQVAYISSFIGVWT